MGDPSAPIIATKLCAAAGTSVTIAAHVVGVCAVSFVSVALIVKSTVARGTAPAVF